MSVDPDKSEEELREYERKEIELSTLRRKIRCMSIDRRSYNDDTRVVLHRQKDEIRKLVEDNRNIKNLIDFMTSKLTLKKDMVSRTRLQDLAQDIDDGKSGINDEKERLRQINFQIHRKDMSKNTQLMVNSKRDKPAVQVLLKRIRTLDNRLETTQCKFNKQLTNNRELREQIDHLRYGRLLYAQLYNNLTKELANTRSEKKKLTKTATDAYTASNEATARIHSITERCVKDKSQHMNDMKGLQRIIEYHDKTAEFMDMKSRDRSKQLNEVLQKRKIMIGDKNYCDEQKMIMKYEDAFGVIKEVAQDSDMEQIIKDYMEKEDQNYAMFNYINDLNESIDAVRIELAVKKEQRDKYRQQNGLEDVFRRTVMKNFEKKDDEISRKVEDYEMKYIMLRKNLDELKKPVMVLFSTIGCDPTPMSGMLGYQEEVNDGNLMQYLGIIEDRAIHTLNTHFFTAEVLKEKLDKDAPKNMMQLAEIMDSPVITCVPPSMIESDFMPGDDSMANQPLDKLRLVAHVRTKLRALFKKSKRNKQKKRDKKSSSRTETSSASICNEPVSDPSSVRSFFGEEDGERTPEFIKSPDLRRSPDMKSMDARSVGNRSIGTKSQGSVRSGDSAEPKLGDEFRSQASRADTDKASTIQEEYSREDN